MCRHWKTVGETLAGSDISLHGMSLEPFVMETIKEIKQPLRMALEESFDSVDSVDYSPCD